MMTRKDYIATAEIIKTYNLQLPEILLEKLVNDFAEMFKADNPRFDANRFRVAAMEVN
jgi:hypothetical protein